MVVREHRGDLTYSGATAARSSPSFSRRLATDEASGPTAESFLREVPLKLPQELGQLGALLFV